jgi:hypothetical protein
MSRLLRSTTVGAVTFVMVLVAAMLGQVSSVMSAQGDVVRAALAPGSINNILVINLENESYASTFGPGSPATYLNGTLVPKGELLQNYFATGHVSLDNYIAEVSGQAPTPQTAADCFGSYTNVSPGTDDPNASTQPGQVDGTGCVYPAPTSTTHGAPTIADQLDAAYPPNATTHVASWRGYAEDMGNDATRDNGASDPLAGTDCAHPAISGTDNTEIAEAADQYTNRHNPFVYFHSIIDNSAECNANVVPLGTVATGTPSTFNGVSLPDTFTGHLANDLSSTATTPKFGFITPNLCNDGHDGTCAGTNIEGGKSGGLTGADLWLKHYVPLIMASPAYQSGQMLVAITFDEGALTDSSSCCNEQPGPNDSAITGGGRVGALLLNNQYIVPGTVDTTGYYNHYSALRSYEDLLGLTSGGSDGYGHLGFAGASGLTPFGLDIFQPNYGPTITTNPVSQSAYAGSTLTFTASADIATPNVQWQYSLNGGSTWANIPGATGTSYKTGALPLLTSGWQVRATFTNAAGSATTNAATMTVTPVPPTTSVLIPSGGATVANTTLLDAGASTTSGSVTSVKFLVTGQGLTNAVVGTGTPTLYGWLANWNTKGVPNGSYALTSVATGSNGTSATSTPVTISVNNAPPSTVVGLPANNATVTGGIWLDANASSGVSQVQYEITGGSYTNHVIGTGTTTIVGWLAYWDSTTIPNGTYTLQSVASYAGGVSGTSAPITITVNN